MKAGSVLEHRLSNDARNVDEIAAPLGAARTRAT
jgi:hypothetical protein